MTVYDPMLERILNATATQSEVERYARLELNGGGSAWVAMLGKGPSKADRRRAGRARAAVAEFLSIFR